MLKAKKLFATLLAAIVASSLISMPTLAEDLTTPIEETVFEEDNLMDENSVSPEEFAELTGITMVEVSSEKVDEAVEQASASLEQASLTWGPTKPWVNSALFQRLCKPSKWCRM